MKTTNLKYVTGAVCVATGLFAAPAGAWEEPDPSVTESVRQVDTEVLGDAPAVETGNLYVETSQALSNAAHNATAAQQSQMTPEDEQGIPTLQEVEPNFPAQ